MRTHESLISHDRLPCAQLCVMITGADPKQEASMQGLNTGSWATGVCVCERVSNSSLVSICQTNIKVV